MHAERESAYIAQPVARLRRPSSLHRDNGEYFVHSGDYVVDQAVFLGLLGGDEVVAVGVALDALEGLAGVLGEDLVQAAAEAQHLAGADLDVAGLTATAALHVRLVDHDGRVGQRVAAARRAAGE